jgi:hypothetical protein
MKKVSKDGKFNTINRALGVELICVSLSLSASPGRKDLKFVDEKHELAGECRTAILCNSYN